MGFIHEKLTKESGLKLMDYLVSIGVTDVLGKPLSCRIRDVTVNREKNDYLIDRGSGLPEDIPYIGYALCLDGKVINLEVQRYVTGHIRNNSREVHWIVNKMEFPKTESFSMGIYELSNIIEDAFMAESYQGPFTPDNTKSVTVEIPGREEKMKFEYRYLSEERAAEIDAMGIITPRGKKLNINYTKCITNEDESIVFQIVFHAWGYDMENEIDRYLLFYKGYQYLLKIDGIWSRKKENGEFKYHSKWTIESEIEEKENCPSEEVLSVLIDILSELSRHRAREIIEGTVEIIYKGKRVK